MIYETKFLQHNFKTITRGWFIFSVKATKDKKPSLNRVQIGGSRWSRKAGTSNLKLLEGQFIELKNRVGRWTQKVKRKKVDLV